MPITIGSNIASLNAQRQLDRSSSSLGTVFERLSSGQRINKASDDAGGLAISSQLSTKSRVLSQGIRNINDGVSTINVASGAIDTLKTVLERMKELALQSANGTFSYKQRVSLDKEVQALRQEYKRIIDSTAFNGRELFKGGSTLSIQVGEGTSGIIDIQFTSGTSVQGGSGSFSSIVRTVSGDLNSSGEQLVGDLNGDGYDDIVRLAGTDAQASVFLNQGNGSFLQGASYSSQFLTETAGVLGDLNNDGKLDLVYGYTNGGGGGVMSVRLGAGDGTFGAEVTNSEVVPYVSDLKLADVNNDGYLDAVSVEGAFNRNNYVAFGRGDGTFQAAVTYAHDSVESRTITLGDFNGDGSIDFLAGGAGGGASRIHTYLNDGSGGFTYSFLNLGAGTNEAQLSNAGDLNSDGILDLAFRNRQTGSIYLTYGNGDGTFSTPATLSFANSSDAAPAIADINGDGSLDIVSAVNNTGIAYKLGDGRGSFGQTVTVIDPGSNIAAGEVIINDFNRDGAPDVVRTLGAGAVGEGFSVYLQTPGAVQSRAEVKPLVELSLKTRSDAYKALKIVSDEFDRLSAVASELGSSLSRLSVASNVAAIFRENYEAALSRILDADVAQESAELTRLTILRRAGAAVLAQANFQPDIALSLLR